MSVVPASFFANAIPSVLSGGGTAEDLVGVCVTSNVSRVPLGSVLTFPNPATVSAKFGPTSDEYLFALQYFQGYTNSTKKPAKLLFAPYAVTAAPAYLRSAPITMTLAQLQTINGVFDVVRMGVSIGGTLNLAAATSYTSAAGIIQTLLGAGVGYDPVDSTFIIFDGQSSPGPMNTISYAVGSAALALGFTQATGAQLSQGAAASTPTQAMTAVAFATEDWASFTTLFEPSDSDKINFATWNSGQGVSYAYIAWDSDAAPAASSNDVTSFSALLHNASLGGTVPLYDTSYLTAAGVMGTIASIDFDRVDGRIALAYKNFPGVVPEVTDGITFQNLEANNYNFVVDAATANAEFDFFYPGSVSGPFKWIDSYVNAIWLTGEFQLALMNLLTSAGVIPYNQDGYGLIKAACQDVITNALEFGAIQSGVPLSSEEAALVNAQAGTPIDTILSTVGYFLQVTAPLNAQVRAARTTPPCTFWYTDGGSVQQITLATVEIQ